MQSYSEVVRTKNSQGIFDRQNELCGFFIALNENDNRFINYRVTNDGIAICVIYNKHSDWNAVEGKKILQKLVEKYKLDLIGYETCKIHFTRSVNFYMKNKLICDYMIPLSLLKFDLDVFYYSKEYLNYKKGDFCKFNLF